MKLEMNLNDQQKRYLMIAGITIGAAALLAYPVMQLVKMIKNRKNKVVDEETTYMKSFAPSYRGSHKPHHRKADANSNLHLHN